MHINTVGLFFLLQISSVVLHVNAAPQSLVSELPQSMSPQPLEENFAKSWWIPRHQEKLAEVKARANEIKLVFIGDSITHAWEDKGKREWAKYYAPRGGLNLGYGGDRTENVLWRIDRGELEGLSPTLVVLMIGTNNTGHREDPPHETAMGITEIVDQVHARLPTTKILLHAIMPRGENNDDPLRKLNEKVNQLIQPLSKRDYVEWINLNYLFVDKDGVIEESVMRDLLHPNVYQYKRWAEALEPTISALMGNAL